MRSKEEKNLASVLTKLWFNQIIREYPHWSLYKIERHLEPLHPSKHHEPLTQHRSKWNKYRNGKHHPGSRTIQKVALHKPHTETIISSRLEKILFSKQPKWNALKDRDIKFALCNSLKYERNYSVNFEDLASLIRIWNYFFKNDKSRFKRQINLISVRIYRMLLLLSLDFNLDDNEENFIRLYQMLASEVFSKANNEWLVFSEKRFINQARILKKATDIHFNKSAKELFSLHAIAHKYMTMSSSPSLYKHPKLLFTPYKNPIFYELNCTYRKIQKQGFCNKMDFMRIHRLISFTCH